MRYVRLRSLLVFAFLSAALAHARPDGPVAVVWTKAPGYQASASDILAARKLLEYRGYRVLGVEGLAPEALRALLLSDRADHPRDYGGTVIPFVVEGREPSGELVSAFLSGIGTRAQGDIIASVCFDGTVCADAGTIPGKEPGRDSRILAAKDTHQITPEPPGDARGEIVLRELAEALANGTMAGEREARRRKSSDLSDAFSDVGIVPKGKDDVDNTDGLLSTLRYQLASPSAR